MRTTGELEQNGYKMCITIFPADWKLKFLFKTTHGSPRFIWWLLKRTIAALPMVFGGPLPLLRHCKAYLMSKEVGGC